MSPVTSPVPPLRVLLVEDCDDDAELLRCELEEAGLVFELLRVCTEAQLQQALAEFAPSLVVSDLNLPGYSGLSALRLVHACQPALPLVLMSGHMLEAEELTVPATVLAKSEQGALAALLLRLQAAAR